MAGSKVLIALDDDVFVFLVEHLDGLFDVTPEEVVDGVDGVLHFYDLVFPEVDEVGVTGSLYFKEVSCDFALDLLAEVLKYPSNLTATKIPF